MAVQSERMNKPPLLLSTHPHDEKNQKNQKKKKAEATVIQIREIPKERYVLRSLFCCRSGRGEWEKYERGKLRARRINVDTKIRGCEEETMKKITRENSYTKA